MVVAVSLHLSLLTVTDLIMADSNPGMPGQVPKNVSALHKWVDQWEKAKKLAETPDDVILEDPDDVPIHRAYCQSQNGPVELESINDKREWIRNNCSCIRSLVKDVEEAIHCVTEAKELDTMLGVMNMAKRALENSNISHLPKVGKIDKYVFKRKRGNDNN